MGPTSRPASVRKGGKEGQGEGEGGAGEAGLVGSLGRGSPSSGLAHRPLPSSQVPLRQAPQTGVGCPPSDKCAAGLGSQASKDRPWVPGGGRQGRNIKTVGHPLRLSSIGSLGGI